MQSLRNDSGVSWLLKSKDPSVRFLTLTEVVGASARSREVIESRGAIPLGPKVKALLKGQKEDGGFGVGPYSKWTGAHWRLVSLVELAIPKDHPRAHSAADQVLDWLANPEVRKSIETIDGRVRQHASVEGNALAVASRLGMAGDPRARILAESLLAAQWPDGGWNCDDRREASHSSFYESAATLWGLAEYGNATSYGEALTAADRACEFFLSHNLFKSSKTGEVIDAEWLKLHYPLYWHYDILHGLLNMLRAGKLNDSRTSEALDILERKRMDNGAWRPGNYYWRPAGSAQSNEVVDWGRGGPNEMITLNALRVLKASGRIG
jgi:hypothetical protein